MAQHIVVRAYNSELKRMFLKEKREIQRILGEYCVEIFHIESTAVPGLKAKPVENICKNGGTKEHVKYIFFK